MPFREFEQPGVSARCRLRVACVQLEHIAPPTGLPSACLRARPAALAGQELPASRRPRRAVRALTRALASALAWREEWWSWARGGF